jgi:hypothetical protein
MECHDVRQLLTFVNRKAEAVDRAERDAIAAHLEQCPDCRALSQAEARADETLGALMGDVPVPAGLKQQVLNRLAADRSVTRWKNIKRGSWAAAAALVFVTLTAGGVLFLRLPANVTQADVDTILAAATKNGEWDEDAAHAYLKAHGVPETVLPPFDFRYLQSVEAIGFKGRKVAKFVYTRGNDVATVFVLPAEQFRLADLEENPTNLKKIVDTERGVIYLILFRGNLGALQPPQISA